MAGNKTVATRNSVSAFLKSVSNDERRRDCKAVMKMMRAITGKRATLWGDSLIGYGKYHYRYASGREGDFFMTGVSPRARNLAIYIMPGFDGLKTQLGKLGKHSTGRSCLYINRLSDVDSDVLYDLIEQSYQTMVERYGA